MFIGKGYPHFDWCRQGSWCKRLELIYIPHLAKRFRHKSDLCPHDQPILVHLLGKHPRCTYTPLRGCRGFIGACRFVAI